MLTNKIPYDEKNERAIIGCFLNDMNAPVEFASQVTSEMFYNENSKFAIEAIQSLVSQGKAIDLLTVFKESRVLKSKLDINYLNDCYTLVNNTSNLPFYILSLKELHVRRVMYQFSEKVAKNALNLQSDPLQLLADVQKKLSDSVDALVAKPIDTLSDIVQSRVKELISDKKETNETGGINSGINGLNEILGGKIANQSLVIIAGRPGQGKCLGLNTMCIMHDGTKKKVQDVVVGDLLMGNDSTPRKVLSLARGKEMMYCVRQTKGVDYRVNESHILSLKRSRKVKNESLNIVNISVKDYIEKSNKFKSNYKGYKVGWELPKVETSLDPYYVGLWLGDGSCDSQRIHNPDVEVIDWLSNYARLLNAKHVISAGKCPANTIVDGDINITKELRKYNLIGNKHIPNDFMYNDSEIRIKLLAGLLDTDGHLEGDGCTFEIIQKNEVLANGIVDLCNSLGFRCSMSKKKSTIKSINFSGEYFRIRIWGDTDKIPTLIKRKQANKRRISKDHQNNGITIEKDCYDDYYGFEIDGNKLFLIEDGTVTHNTSIALNIAKNACVNYGKSGAIFSLEMSKEQLTDKLIACESGIDSRDITRGVVHWSEREKLMKSGSELMNAKLFIDDSSNLTPMVIRSKATSLKIKENIDFIIVDYLQLMSSDDRKNKNREAEISEISRALKLLAKDLNIPVIALSQLSRACEARADKRPILSDLRESGSIEQDADAVMFVFRPEYYNFNVDENGESLKGKAELIFAKNRFGETGIRMVQCDMSKSLFWDNNSYSQSNNIMSQVEQTEFLF